MLAWKMFESDSLKQIITLPITMTASLLLLAGVSGCMRSDSNGTVEQQPKASITKGRTAPAEIDPRILEERDFKEAPMFSELVA